MLGKHQNCVLITSEEPQLPQATLGRIEGRLFCTMERQATLMITDQCPEHAVKSGVTKFRMRTEKEVANTVHYLFIYFENAHI